MWDERAGAFFDFDWQRGRLCTALTAATVTPLYVGLASREQARRIARTVRQRLLSAGGIATTEIDSDQQWDHPNGWAPLQWLAKRGFDQYDETALAQDISDRWLKTVGKLYERKNKLIEKYSLIPMQAGAVGGGGGEYPLQDGFGWTNGVTRRLLRDSPRHSANQSRAQKP